MSRVSCLGFNIPVASIDDSPVRAALRTALTGALKQRDRQAAGVYRSALAAVDNAEAVPLDDSYEPGAVETSPSGVGQTETRRRQLTETEVANVVEAEAQERCAAADQIADTDAAAAQKLRDEASLLRALLGSAPTD